ncbi:MAG: thiamine phosphate synthase, partial [Thiomargarita sp.]|nr:thiamine phosphate synthase [Thiomargarita sp.]
MQFSLNGLYAITDSHLIRNSQLISTVEQAIMGGACIIQYRDKTTKLALRIQQAQAINQLCKRFQIPFIINDDIELAQQVGANGVHLGKNDTKLAIARQKLG